VATPDDQKADRQLVYFLGGLLSGAGLLFDVIYSGGLAAGICKWAAFFSTFGAGALLAFSSFTGSALFGLLFGIPKAYWPGEQGEDSGQASAPNKFLSPNNNLVQISDWLTKVLVGATLTQITKLPDGLVAFGARYGPVVGSDATAVFLLVGFSASGFLSGYLFTRVVLQQALHRAGQVQDAAKGEPKLPSTGEAVDPNAFGRSPGSAGVAPCV
jgi:hypothetical protein